MKNILAAGALGLALTLPVIAVAQSDVEFNRLEEEKTLPKELYAPTTPNEPLPGPKVVTKATCEKAPEVCAARKEELRRKRQACRDNAANCSDPALARSEATPQQ